MNLNAKASGQTELTVVHFDSVYGILELKSDPGGWVTFCAAKYYGVKSIIAVEKNLAIPACPIGK
jgi:hypothetical protein